MATQSYSFSSRPKPVTAARKKFREPGEVDLSMYRDLKETGIQWDKRVHRGNTYGMYTQNAIKEALAEASQAAEPKPKIKRKPQEARVFDMPMPEMDRIPVDLSAHLVAKEVVVEVDTVDTQTDEFRPELKAPLEQYQPKKTGVDTETQVEDGELFDFDMEVQPILEVLVSKTLEQSIMEVEEEHEMNSMKEFKDAWYKRQASMEKDWQEQVQAECKRWEEKNAIVAQRRKEKETEARVLLKIQARHEARAHLAQLVPNALADLKPVAFPDADELAITRLFMPQLIGNVQKEVQMAKTAAAALDGLVAQCVQQRAEVKSQAYAAMREKSNVLEQRRREENQIRRGRIRIMVDDGAGGSVPVGPVQISSTEGVDAVQRRVFEWLAENEPRLAALWPHGVTLCIAGEPVQDSAQIFEAKAGMISMVPVPAPPPEEEDGQDGHEEEEEEEE